MTERTEQTKRRRPRALAFYRRVLEESDAGALTAAAHAEGLDAEVALVRVLLRRQLEAHPQNLESIVKGMHLLVRMVVAQHNLSGADAEQFTEGVKRAINQFAQSFLGTEAADG